MDGWVKLHRSIIDNWIWKDKPFSKGQAWLDLIIMANHKDNKFPFGDEIITVERGSLITSELKLMDRWGWSKSKLRYFLNSLEIDSMIVKKTDRKKTTITIVNYSVFQEIKTTEEPKKDHQQTDDRPIKDTNKNVKNDKNVKNNKSNSRFTPPTLEEVKNYCSERNNNVDAERFIDFYASKGWMVGKTKMKDWKACVRTWEKDSKPAQAAKQNKFCNFETTNYDFDDLERSLLDVN